MRALFYALAALGVIGLAYWAYNENYATQAALKRVEVLQREIASTREHLGVLRAEWAYLNRPDRLRELSDLNYKSLRLMPLAPDHFGDTKQVAFPKVRMQDLTRPVDLSAQSGSTKATPGPGGKP